MKPPRVLRAVSRPTALIRPHHPLKIGHLAALNARELSATPRRPFIDECLVPTHTLICGVHDMTGLPWAATIPLVAFLVRLVIVAPLNVCCNMEVRKKKKLVAQFEKSRPAIENKIQKEHGDKSPLERQKIQNREIDYMRRQLLKQGRARAYTLYLAAFAKVPIWFMMMETIRRMTGTEDGMLFLSAKSLMVLKGQQNAGPGTMDELIPTEPSLAAEGMLWFDNLMIPDPSLILPFALSGIVFVIFSSDQPTVNFTASPGSTPERVRQVLSWNLRKKRTLKLGALAVGPATLMFPSAMLLYSISAGLVAVILGHLPRILLFLVTKAIRRGTPDEGKQSKPKLQEYRGPTMKDLRNQRKRK